MAAFIADAAVGRSERLVRGLNLRLTELGERRWEYSADQEALELCQDEIDAIFTGATACGIAGKYQSGSKLPYFATKATTQAMIQDAIDDEVGGSFWKNMSACGAQS